MNIQKVSFIYFSPTETAKRIVKIIYDSYNLINESYDITDCLNES